MNAKGQNKRGYSRLTDTIIKHAKPGRYGDRRGGHGLSLLAKRTPSGRMSKTWSQRIRIEGELATIGLGTYPLVSLEKARDKAWDNARRVAEGENILMPPPTIPTVYEGFDAVIKQRRISWKDKLLTEKNWLISKRYCETIGHKLVSEIKQKDVVNVLTPIWQEKPHTARTVRKNLNAVMRWAIGREYRTTNPATPSVAQELGKQPPAGHHLSLEPQKLGSALATVRDADVWWAAKYCLIFLALTGVRSGEARLATWEEIDLDSATWTIPGSRTKNSIELKVPLSTQAIEILLHAQEQTGRTKGIIFPPELGGRHMGAGILSRLMRRLGIPAVPHGDRSSVRNWAGGRADIAQPAAEMVLGHKQGPQIQQVYLTSDFFEHRQPMMQEWADFLEETMGPVISTVPEESEESREAQRERRVSSPVRAFKVDPIGEDEYKLIVQNLQKTETQDAHDAWAIPDQNTLHHAVDIAAIALMRDGMLRPKATANVRWSDLKREPDGSGLLNIRSSKKNRPGKDHVVYMSPRTMKVLDEMHRIRQQLTTNTKDDRILQLTEKALPKLIQKACHAAGLTGAFSGYSPRNGMAQDLTRSGVGVNDLKKAKGWRLMALDHTEREDLARHGPVAHWYAQKQEQTTAP